MLPYPEGTACADVLVAGERGGKLATLVFAGLGVGALWKALSWIVQICSAPRSATRSPRTSQFPNATINVDVSPEYLGVGYVIGPRIAGMMFAGRRAVVAGAAAAALDLGSFLTEPFPPIHPNFVNNPATGRPFLIRDERPVSCGAPTSATSAPGAVLASGLITLARTIPTIISSARGSVKDLSAPAPAAAADAHRTRPADGRRAGRLAAAGRLPRRHAGPADAGQRRRGRAHPRLRVLLRHRVVADHRPHRHRRRIRSRA